MPLRLPVIPAILAACCAAFPALAGTSVTIANLSGQDLLIARAAGSGDRPILVTAQGDAPSAAPRRLCPPKYRNPLEQALPQEPAGEAPTAGPADPPPHQVLLRKGDVATLSGDGQGGDLEAQLVLYRVDSEAGIIFNGLVIFSLVHKPGPDSTPEPEATLALPGGPTPRLRTISCNRGLTLVSPSELSVGAPAPGKPLAERKDLPDQPLP